MDFKATSEGVKQKCLRCELIELKFKFLDAIDELNIMIEKHGHTEQDDEE